MIDKQTNTKYTLDLVLEEGRSVLTAVLKKINEDSDKEIFKILTGED